MNCIIIGATRGARNHNLQVAIYESTSRIFLFLLLSAFLDTGLPRLGNVYERDSGPMRGAIRTQPLSP